MLPPLPPARLPATTPLYDMLRLFQTGRSHMAVLTAPPPGELRAALASDPSNTHGRPSTSGKASKKKSQLVLDPSAPQTVSTNAHGAGGSGSEPGAGDTAGGPQDGSLVLDPSAPGSKGDGGHRRNSRAESAGGGGKGGGGEGGTEGGEAVGRGGALLRAARVSDDGGSVGGGGSLYGDGYAESALYADSVADGDMYGTGGFASSLLSPGGAAVAAFLDSPDGHVPPSRGPTGLSLASGEERGEQEQAEGRGDVVAVASGAGSGGETGSGAQGGSRGVFTSVGGAEAAAAAAADGVSAEGGQHAAEAAGEAGQGASESAGRHQQQHSQPHQNQHKKSRMAPKGEAADGHNAGRASSEAEHGHGQGQAHGHGAAARRLQATHSGLYDTNEEWLEEEVEEGTPIGIITIEDVIEEVRVGEGILVPRVRGARCGSLGKLCSALLLASSWHDRRPPARPTPGYIVVPVCHCTSARLHVLLVTLLQLTGPFPTLLANLRHMPYKAPSADLMTTHPVLTLSAAHPCRDRGRDRPLRGQ